MATNFPSSLDSLTNPSASDSLASPSHSAQHANANDAIEALEAKVGVDNSAVTTSLDYKVGVLTLLTETTTRTANYTLALTDQNRVVPMNGTSLTLTVPTDAAVAFPVGAIVNVYNLNATDVTIQGDSGVTVRNDGDLAQYGEVSLRKRDTDEWVVAGNLS